MIILTIDHEKKKKSNLNLFYGLSVYENNSWKLHRRSPWRLEQCKNDGAWRNFRQLSEYWKSTIFESSCTTRVAEEQLRHNYHRKTDIFTCVRKMVQLGWRLLVYHWKWLSKLSTVSKEKAQLCAVDCWLAGHKK